MTNSEILEHIGVLGMKWGRRKTNNVNREKRRKIKEEKRNEKILKSPRLLSKNLDRFSQKEIDDAVKKMRLHRDLHQLDIAKLKKGSDYVNLYLGAVTSLTAVYGFYKSPLGQRIASGLSKVSKLS